MMMMMMMMLVTVSHWLLIFKLLVKCHSFKKCSSKWILECVGGECILRLVGRKGL